MYLIVEHSLNMPSLPLSTSPILSHLNGISHGFFGSRGGVSKGLYKSLNAGVGSADDPIAVAKNRRRIATQIGAESDAYLVSCHQHHSSDALRVEAPFNGRPKGDAMVTDRPGLALAIMTADCVPILFADDKAGVIGAAHSGWKGALGGISEATIEVMEGMGAQTARITAVIGPCIRQASYEVGPEFRDEFLATAGWSERFFTPGKADRLHFDLPGFVEARLRQAGLSQIDIIAHDTCALANQYFSNRRRNHEGLSDYGRNASVIMLNTV